MLFRNKKKEFQALQKHQVRLRGILNDLLALADETDQQSKYIGGTLDPAWSAQLRSVCNELVQLGHELEELDRLVDNKRIDEGRVAVLDFCRKADEIAKALKSIRKP